ncbi:hypothetical protein SANTM175S_07697 [Streptomyces antimycoticus]
MARVRGAGSDGGAGRRRDRRPPSGRIARVRCPGARGRRRRALRPADARESREASRIAVDAATRPGTAPARGGKEAKKGTAGGERNAAGGSGAEPLDTHRAPRAKSASSAPDSRAEVQLYDYASDTLITRLVDLRSKKVLDSARQHGVQPPPTLAEAREAVKVVLADPRLGPGMRDSYTNSPCTAAG